MEHLSRGERKLVNHNYIQFVVEFAARKATPIIPDNTC